MAVVELATQRTLTVLPSGRAFSTFAYARRLGSSRCADLDGMAGAGLSHARPPILRRGEKRMGIIAYLSLRPFEGRVKARTV